MTKTRLYFAVLVGLLPAVFSFAANRTWDNPDGGDFGDGDNWSGGTVPGVGDIAEVNANGDYTIHLDQDRTISGFRLDGSSSHQNVTLDLGGYILQTTSTGTADFVVSSTMSKEGVPASRLLRIVNGELEGGNLRVESNSDAEQPGQIIVGQNGVLRSEVIGVSSRIGNGGMGRVEVVDNGRFESKKVLYIGNFAGAEGTLMVDGAEARFEGTHLYVGNHGRGHMHILNGAKATLSSHLRLAAGDQSVPGVGGHLELSGGSELTVAGEFLIGAATSAAIGHAQFGKDSLISVQRFTVQANSILEINGGSVTAGGTSLLRPDAIYQLFLNEVDATPLQVNSLTITNAILDVQLGEDFVAEMGGIYTIIDYASTLTGSFVDTDGQTLSNGDEITIGDYVFRLDYGNRSDGIVGLELVAIPEPSTFVLLSGLLAVSGVVLLRRYKK